MSSHSLDSGHRAARVLSFWSLFYCFIHHDPWNHKVCYITMHMGSMQFIYLFIFCDTGDYSKKPALNIKRNFELLNIVRIAKIGGICEMSRIAFSIIRFLWVYMGQQRIVEVWRSPVTHVLKKFVPLKKCHCHLSLYQKQCLSAIPMPFQSWWIDILWYWDPQ